MSNRNQNKGGSGDVAYDPYGQQTQKPIKGLDNGVLKRYGSTDPADGANYGTRANISFPGILARGENPGGFRSITPNGVQEQSDNNDYNSQSNYKWGGQTASGGPRWGNSKGYKGDMSGN